MRILEAIAPPLKFFGSNAELCEGRPPDTKFAPESVSLSGRDKISETATLPTRRNLREVSPTRVVDSDPGACDVASVVARLDRGERNCANAKLPYARFSGLSLRWVILDGADLRGACFDDCDLSFASLRGANLAGASFQGAILDTAILDSACLREADLRGANLARATMESVDLRHAVIDKTTVWPSDFDPTDGGAFVLGRSRDSKELPAFTRETGEHEPQSRGAGVTTWLGECAAYGGEVAMEADGSGFDVSYDDDDALEAALADPLTRIISPAPPSRVTASPLAWVNPRLAHCRAVRRPVQ